MLAKERFGIRGRELTKLGATFIEFSAKTRISGIDYQGKEVRKGAADAIQNYVLQKGGRYPEECTRIVKEVAGKGGTPLVVAADGKVLGCYIS